MTNYPDLLGSRYGYSLRKYLIGLVISLLLNASVVFMSVGRVSVTLFIASMVLIVECLLQYICVRQWFLPFTHTTHKYNNCVSTILMHDMTVLL